MSRIFKIRKIFNRSLNPLNCHVLLQILQSDFIREITMKDLLNSHLDFDFTEKIRNVFILFTL